MSEMKIAELETTKNIYSSHAPQKYDINRLEGWPKGTSDHGNVIEEFENRGKMPIK
jgi:hypothetical protein